MVIVQSVCVRFVCFNTQMTPITRAEFEGIVDGIAEDRESIVRNNPIGTAEEILLWMLLNSLVIYLNLTEIETPCFAGRTNAKTYREAIEFVLRGRVLEEFDVSAALDKLS